MKKLPIGRVTGSIAVLVPIAALALLLWQPWDGGDSDSPSEAAGVENITPTPAADGLSGILATNDLSLGLNRVSFLVISPLALVTVPQISVTSIYLPADGSSPVVKEEATAPFYLWPYGTRGNYVTQLTFDSPGNWELAVSAQDADGLVGTARIPMNVSETSATPALGSLPPVSTNKTVADVTSLSQITSSSSPDPDLYQMTIAQAANSQGPSLVVFASPALCTSPICGPQVDTVSELKESYKDQVSFIHVEVYDNPDQIQGDLRTARYSPVAEAWGLPEIEDYLNESWIFILDREGRIALKYQGFASVEELEQDLLQVIQSNSS
jgi:hypothetical protein